MCENDREFCSFGTRIDPIRKLQRWNGDRSGAWLKTYSKTRKSLEKTSKFTSGLSIKGSKWSSLEECGSVKNTSIILMFLALIKSGRELSVLQKMLLWRALHPGKNSLPHSCLKRPLLANTWPGSKRTGWENSDPLSKCNWLFEHR